jgi:hypothetical protein
VLETTLTLVSQADNVVDLRTAAPSQVLPSRPDHETPRQIDPEEWRRFRGYIGEIFAALGMVLDTPGTRETPERFLRALLDSTGGYEGDPKLLTSFRPRAADPTTRLQVRSSKARSRSLRSASTTRSPSSASPTSATSRATRSSGSRS